MTVNPGSTSTKVGLFRDEEEIFSETIRHSKEELERFEDIPSQLEFRKATVMRLLEEKGYSPSQLDAVAGRGGLLKPLQSGTYRVNEAMVRDLKAQERGAHASNLGGLIAREIADEGGKEAYIVDPVSVDEWWPLSRYSGMKGLDRICLSHALNTKAVAKRYAARKGKAYEELRLLVVHLGSGITVSAHIEGRMVDSTNGREEGAFAPDRSGSLPVMALLDLIEKEKPDMKSLRKRIFGKGGIYSYLETSDMQGIVERINRGDEQAREVVEAMIYQIAKDVGAMATVLEGDIDALIVTGGMAHNEYVIERLCRRIRFIKDPEIYPGEDELRALAEGVLRVFYGEEDAREYA